jgi:hypothetical protein
MAWACSWSASNDRVIMRTGSPSAGGAPRSTSFGSLSLFPRASYITRTGGLEKSTALSGTRVTTAISCVLSSTVVPGGKIPSAPVRSFT